MPGRRSHERYGFTQPADGTIRVYSDVIVKWHAADEWIAVSREPAVVGETLVLDVDDGEQRNRFTVCVIESRPVIIDGDKRHRIRLHNARSQSMFLEQQVRRS